MSMNGTIVEFVLNILRAEQNGRYSALGVDIDKYIFLKENAWIFIKISLRFVPKGWIVSI